MTAARTRSITGSDSAISTGWLSDSGCVHRGGCDIAPALDMTRVHHGWGCIRPLRGSACWIRLRRRYRPVDHRPDAHVTQLGNAIGTNGDCLHADLLPRRQLALGTTSTWIRTGRRRNLHYDRQVETAHAASFGCRLEPGGGRGRRSPGCLDRRIPRRRTWPLNGHSSEDLSGRGRELALTLISGSPGRDKTPLDLNHAEGRRVGAESVRGLGLSLGLMGGHEARPLENCALPGRDGLGGPSSSALCREYSSNGAKTRCHQRAFGKNTERWC